MGVVVGAMRQAEMAPAAIAAARIPVAVPGGAPAHWRRADGGDEAAQARGERKLVRPARGSARMRW